MTIEKLLNGKVLEVDLYGTIHRPHFSVERYRAGNRIALQLLSDDEEPFACLTVNLPEAPLEDNQIIVKTWTENEPIAKAALASGLFRDTGRRIPTGHVQAQVWEVVDREDDDADLEDGEYSIRQAQKRFEAQLDHADFLLDQRRERGE